MFNVTNIIIFFFIPTLTHYVITQFLGFPEVFFAICSSYFISGFGAGNLKIARLCCLTVVILNILMHILFNLCLF